MEDFVRYRYEVFFYAGCPSGLTDFAYNIAPVEKTAVINHSYKQKCFLEMDGTLMIIFTLSEVIMVQVAILMNQKSITNLLTHGKYNLLYSSSW